MYLDPLLPSASIGEKDKWENWENGQRMDTWCRERRAKKLCSRGSESKHQSSQAKKQIILFDHFFMAVKCFWNHMEWCIITLICKSPDPNIDSSQANKFILNSKCGRYWVITPLDYSKMKVCVQIHSRQLQHMNYIGKTEFANFSLRELNLSSFHGKDRNHWQNNTSSRRHGYNTA